jgi:hypothetical protein
MEGGQRRTLGFVLFGSAVLMVVVAGLLWAGVIDMADDSRGTVATAVGMMGILDAAVGGYFILSSQS